MRNTMRTIGRICFFGLVMAVSASAQKLQSSPSPAVEGPAFDLSAGYAYLSMPISSAGRVNFNGVDFSGNIGLSSR